MHCDLCGAETVSELDHWVRWYTDGEDWLETCSGCGQMFDVTLRTRKTRPLRPPSRR
jgi:hypothetical protein